MRDVRLDAAVNADPRQITIKVLEIAPDKHVVWALSQWNDPDLGPFSSIQLLDEPGAAERGDYQR